MISLVKIYREMFENEQKQSNDLTKQLDALKAENDALRQKNSDLNNQISEHVKKCLCCENFKFVQEIQFLNHKISELKGLLKECLPIVSAEIMTWQIRGGEEARKRGKELLAKIEEALK